MSDRLWDKVGQSPTRDNQVERFTVGNDHLIDRFIFGDDCRGSIAHAAALTRAGILTGRECGLLQKGLLNLIGRHEDEGITIDRSMEDCHTAIEAALTEALGDLGKKIHTGRSRNDQVLTALRLYSKRRLLDVSEAIHSMASNLLQRAKSGMRLPMPGYSHTRPAMPTTVAVWLGGFVELLLCDTKILRAAYEQNDRSPLGSAAGFGSTIPLDREFTRDLLGFKDLQINALACQTSRGKVEGEIVHALESVQDTLDTLARDMILYSTVEFGFLSLPNELTTGSSIMPQKRNPDVLELVRGKRGVVVGACSQIRAVGSGTTSGYHRDYQLLKEPLINALQTVQDCAELMARVVLDVAINESAMNAACTRDIYAADIASQKAQEGIPFRDAYKEAMKELEGLDVDEEFVVSRIDAYQTLGSMGNPGLERYEGPLSEFGSWIDEERALLRQTYHRLREPLTD
jgi:argininosuccinate lyase